MAENVKDTQRAILAVQQILDGRRPDESRSNILVTAEHAIASLLLLCMDGDPRKAAAMLNEALVPGVEQRLAWFASNKGAH